MKRVISILITLSMLFALVSFPARAAEQNPPVVVRNTWGAMPGEAIGIYGANFEKAGMRTEVLLLPASQYHGETAPEADMYSLTILNQDDGVIQAVINENVPKDVYIGFVKVGEQFSKPFFINEAQVDWIGEPEICSGQTVRVFGRNFLNPKTGNGSTLEAYLVSTDGSLTYKAEKISNVTAYTFDFLVPDGIELGKEYLVKVNNGASKYGTGTLEEYEKVLSVPNQNFAAFKKAYGTEIAWADGLKLDQTFNVKDYGAVGDGTTDDLKAVTDTLNAAQEHNGGIVYFPAGTYNLTKCTEGFTIPDGTLLLGDGKEQSIIQIDKRINSAPNYSGIIKIGFYSDLKRPADEQVRRIAGYVGSLIIASGANVHFILKDFGMKVADGSSVVSYQNKQFVIEDSSFDITHQGPMFTNENVHEYMKLRFLRNYVKNTQRSMVWIGGHSWIENNEFEGANGGENCEKDWNSGKVATMEHRISEMWGDKIFYGNNHIYGTIGDIREGFDDNSGEGICNQATQRIQVNTVTSATENTITADVDFDKIKNGEDPIAQKRGKSIVGAWIAITSGRGIGQMRKVSAVQGNTVTVDKPWDVIPEEDSVFYIDGSMAERYMIVNNNIEAQTRKGGIMLYNNSYDCIIDNNTLTNSGGIWLGKAQVKSQNRNTIAFYNYVGNNKLSGGVVPKNSGGARDGALSIGTGDDGGMVMISDPEIPAVSQFGNLYRKNVIDGNGKVMPPKSNYNELFVKYNGFVVSTLDPNNSKYELAKGIMLDSNTAHNSVNGVSLSVNAANTLLYNNDFTDNGKDYNDTGSVKTAKAEKVEDEAAITEQKPAGLTEAELRKVPELLTVPVKPADTNNPDSELPTDSAKTFADIQGHWAQKDIELLAKLNLVKGIDENTFAPDQPITRAEWITLAMKAMKLTYPSYKYQGLFVDVNKNDWYSMTLEKAFLLGLIDKNMVYGWSIRPNEPITREELASVIIRGMDALELERRPAQLSDYADTKDISAWAMDYMCAAKGRQIMQGNDQNRLCPQERATRAEAVIVLENLLKQL